MNVAVIHEAVAPDARADELDVLDQVAAVVDALDELGHEHVTLGITSDPDDLIERLRRSKADVVFNLVESIDGSGQNVDRVPAALARADMAFTGSAAAAMTIAASKLLTKRYLVESGLPTPAWCTAADLADGHAPAATRHIIKSVWEHGSLGLEDDCVVSPHDPLALRAEIERRAPRLGGSAFAEAYVPGREFNLALLARGRDVEHLPAAEIVFEPASSPSANPRDAVCIVGYRAKWSPGSAEDLATPRSFELAPRDEGLVARMRRLARATWTALGLEGYARVDFRVDAKGEPWIIDVNTNPCLSPGAGFAAALEEAGIRFHDAIARILDAALIARDDRRGPR